MSLFNRGSFTLHSGQQSDWLIDCDALTEEDLDALAYIFSTYQSYQSVVSIPTGGDRFARALRRYQQPRPLMQPLPIVLIADDVLTTGSSFASTRRNILLEMDNISVKGVVIFARKPPPQWVVPIFRVPSYWSPTLTPNHQTDTLAYSPQLPLIPEEQLRELRTGR